MLMKGLVAATAALGLMAAPAIAADRSASVLPELETVEGSQLGGGNVIVVILALAAVIGGILVIADGDEDLPTSP